MTKRKLFDRLYAFIKNAYGVCAIMGNFDKESDFESNNMQNCYEDDLNMTDEQYTAAVDNGTYTDFVGDSVGYGYAQWTSAGRKAGLLELAKKQGVSIGDEDMQLDYVEQELTTGYKSVLNALRNATSVKEASDIVCTKYERPADQSEKALERRAALGEAIYRELIKEEKTMRVCIDPGHGGKENRSPGVPQYYESERMLELSLRQKKYLEQLGVEVVMTRTTANTNPALQARGKASVGCDAFISNHSNAVGNVMNENIDHVAVYHLTDDNTTEADEISKDLAQRLAPVIAQIMGVEDGYKVLQRKAQSDRNKDGIFNDNYYGVLHGARLVNTPGIILEHGFHTHTATVMWLMDDKNLDMLARAEAQVIYEYLFELKTRIKVAQPILKQGCSGYQVGILQENLNQTLGDDLKKKLEIDEDFGPETAAAMELFQEKYDLEQDKIYGPVSYAKMKEVLESMAKEETAPEEPKEEIPEVEVPKAEEPKTETTERIYCVHVGNLNKETAEALKDELVVDGYKAVVI